MKKIVLVLLFMPSLLFAQSGSKAEFRYIDSSWTVNPREFKPELDLTIISEEAPLPGGDLTKEQQRALKAKVNEVYPRTLAEVPSRGGSRSGDTLSILSSFPADFFLTQLPMNGGTPNDNTLAISDDGHVIVSWNTQLWAYDIVADTYMFAFPNKHPSFGQFINVYTDDAISLNSPFDPKLLYDPINERFILVFLTGREPENSGAVVCFSSSTDPKDLWYAYFLPGNPLSYETWTDYPQVAINEHSLYLTLNQLYPDSGWVEGFAETVIWQMDLNSGFSGDDSLATKLWTGFQYDGGNLRYLHPVKSGMGPDGTAMHFVANRPFNIENDSFFLIDIDGDVFDANENVNVQLAKSDKNYGYPPYAQQSGGNEVFWTNDARVLGAVRMQDEIQFTGNTVDPASGKATIYHGKISDINDPSVQLTILTDPEKEFGFPNIAFMGLGEQDRDVAIFANHTGENVNAGNSIVYVDNSGSMGPIKTVKDGETYVSTFLPEERWGDYTGMQRKFDATSRVWVSGYWGYNQNRPGIWIAELASPRDWPLGETPVEENKVKVFPMPAQEWVNIEFDLNDAGDLTVEVSDVQGRIVTRLKEEGVPSGMQRMAINTADLAPGTYVIVLRTGNELLLSKQLIVE